MKNDLGRYEFLRRTLDAMSGVIAYVDQSWKYLYCNKASAAILGKSRDEMEGRAIREILGDEIYANREGPIVRALAGETVEHEGPLRTPQGVRIMKLKYVPDRDANGDVVGTFVFGEDVTRERNIEALLRESEARFRHLADHLPVGVWLLENGKIYLNRSFLEYSGLDPSENDPEVAKNTLHPDDLPGVLQCYQDSIVAGAIVEFEYRRRRYDGIYRWFLGRCLPIKGEDGQVIKVLGTAVDIHDLKNALRARDEFLSIASHELKTPLASLGLQMELRLSELADGGVDAFTPEKLEQMFRRDEAQVEKLSRLIEDMLDISRMESGNLAIARERFDLAAEVREIVERFLPQLKSVGCEIHLHCEGPVEGRWDRARIEQIFGNLLTNAMRYGRGKPIEVRVETGGNEALLQVRDEGIGIAPEDHDRIFGKFERIAPADGIRGLGIGLFVVRQLVALHGGTIHVESRLGQGAHFIVRLPR